MNLELKELLTQKGERIRQQMDLLIPEHMHQAVWYWLWDGIEPGDFLSAVISNDLRGAVLYADHYNTVAIPNWVRFFSSSMPSDSWGSKEKMSRWRGWNAMIEEPLRPEGM